MDGGTHNQRKMEQEWRDETTEDVVHFLALPNPRTLRRHSIFNGALASLHFGAYHNGRGEFINDQRAVSLFLITSDVAGEGKRLLARILDLTSQYSMFLVGEVIPLRPAHWPDE